MLAVAPTDCSTCISYQCLDWTIGSTSNSKREASFKARTKQDVYFGVGSYGNNITRAGYCYRLTATNVAKDIIVQVVHQGAYQLVNCNSLYSHVYTLMHLITGADVRDGNFDLITADGGFGLFDV